MNIEEIIAIVIDAAKEVRHHLYAGYLEYVYRNALKFELETRGLKAEREVELPVVYKGQVVGNYRADLIVNDELIIELKAVSELNSLHEAQLVNYLQATGMNHGLLINFGSELLRVKRKYRIYTPKTSS